jgi:hypothetical protein
VHLPDLTLCWPESHFTYRAVVTGNSGPTQTESAVWVNCVGSYGRSANSIVQCSDATQGPENLAEPVTILETNFPLKETVST